MMMRMIMMKMMMMMMRMMMMSMMMRMMRMMMMMMMVNMMMRRRRRKRRRRRMRRRRGRISREILWFSNNRFPFYMSVKAIFIAVKLIHKLTNQSFIILRRRLLFEPHDHLHNIFQDKEQVDSTDDHQSFP